MTAPKKRKRGRPTGTDLERWAMQLRVRPEERKIIEAAAKADLLPVATWARRVLLRAGAERAQQDSKTA